MARGGKGEAGLIDLVSTGLPFGDIADLTEYKAVRAADPDAAPGLPDHPIVRPGDLWTLGDHRIICGDSTDAATVARVLAGEKPHLMVTDPPYGVEYDPDWRNKSLSPDRTYMLAGGRAIGTVSNDEWVDWSLAWRLFPGSTAYVWHASWHISEVQRSLELAGFVIRCLIIWNKPRFVIGRGDYHWKHEPCWYAVRKGEKGHWNAGRDQTTVWDIQHTVSESGHGTQKPIECMRRPIVNNSAEGDAVYEPFSGSGTTIIAAEMERRRCLAVELNPLYVYVAIARWQNFTGCSATLDGEPFAEVVRRRKDEPAGGFPVALPEVVEFEGPAQPNGHARRLTIAPPRAAEPPNPPSAPTNAPQRVRIEPTRPKLVFEETRRVELRAAPDTRTPFVDPFLAHHREQLRAAGVERIDFGRLSTAKTAVGFDVEVFPNFAVFCFERFSDGTRCAFELSDRSPLDVEGLRRVLSENLIVTFNGTTYDLPITALALSGASNAALKAASDRIIRENLRGWQVERELGVAPLRVDHVDLMEPNPSVRQGLKMLHARLHGRFLVDLPFDPDKYLIPEEMNVATLYCFNDLDATRLLREAMVPALALRAALGKSVGMDLRSKSDSQIGEAIVKKRVEQRLGKRIDRRPPEVSRFGYEPPEFIEFREPQLVDLLSKLRTAEFIADPAGKIEPPDFLKNLTIEVSGNKYSFGLGGLHSTEAHRALHSDDDSLLIDIDVASQYPNIILKLGIYPPAMGPKFLDVYRELVEERLEAKKKQQQIEKEIVILEAQLKEVERG